MTARPGRIRAEIAIEIPYPRGHALRTQPIYDEFCRAASARLVQAIEA